MWAAFGALLICQFLIDFDTQFLPDSLNYPLLWLGLIGAAAGWTGVSLNASVWGAVFGYLSLWLVYHGFRLITGKEGMGYGDFKLLAALGAWLGADYLHRDHPRLFAGGRGDRPRHCALPASWRTRTFRSPSALSWPARAWSASWRARTSCRQWIPFAFPLGALVH